MKIFNLFMIGVMTAVLTACGGGGGSTGTTTGGTGGTGGTTIGGKAETLLTAQLKDSVTGLAVQSVSTKGTTNIVGVLTTKDGKPVSGQVVTLDEVISSDLLSYPNGRSAVTDANGIAKIPVSRINLYEFGNETISLKFDSTDLYASSSTDLIAYRADPPILQISLLDASNTVTDTISSIGLTSLNVSLRFLDGTPVAQKRVEVTGDLTKIVFPEGNSQITNNSGIAIIKVSRASSGVGGAGTLKAAATISGVSASGLPVDTVVTGGADYSLGAVTGVATLSLDTLNTGGASLSAYGTRQISVRAMLGTSVARSVQVNFSSNCGQISPASVQTNASGIAVTSFTATDVVGTTPSTLGCSGKIVDISASAVGADTINGDISVLAAPATNLSYVIPADVTKSRIYLANSGGPTQTSVQFLLTNAREEPLPNQDVIVSLKTVNDGIPKATFNTVTNIDPVTLTTDSFGKVTVPVFSGTVPTNVVLNATLVTNTAIKTDSSVIAIASGRPAQARVSLAKGVTAIRGFNFNGSTTSVTMSLADRQGNPVPDGTVVNFVTEGGVMIPPTCVTGAVPGDSQCTVNIRSQNPRPVDGIVSILAYTAGEEDFIDANFNNVFDCSEIYTDLVTAYRDERDNGSTAINIAWGVPNAYITGQFSVPRSASASLCGAGRVPTPTTGDGVWGAADVRAQILVVFSTDDFQIINPMWMSASDPQWSNARVTTGLVVSIADMNLRSVPTGSTISVTAVDNSRFSPVDDPTATAKIYGSCQLVSQSHKAVPDAIQPLALTVGLKECVAGDQVNIEVNTPAGSKIFTLSVP